MVWCLFWAVCSMVLGIAVNHGFVLVLGIVFNVVGNRSINNVLYTFVVDLSMLL